MGGNCFPEIIPKLRRNLKTRLDEDPGLEGVFGDGARSKVRCKLGSKREEGNTREKETWAGSGGQGQTGTDSSSVIANKPCPGQRQDRLQELLPRCTGVSLGLFSKLWHRVDVHHQSKKQKHSSETPGGLGRSE